jgi:quercetin dioxygenase-like cupin family protein
MHIFSGAEAPLRPADPASFVGPARTGLLASSADAVPVHLYRVEFGERARTNWHAHSGPQWLFILEGRVRVQTAGQAARDVTAGDAVLFAPGEKHWHGAAPGDRGAHLAVNVNVKTEWLEPVTDEQYEAPADYSPTI